MYFPGNFMKKRTALKDAKEVAVNVDFDFILFFRITFFLLQTISLCKNLPCTQIKFQCALPKGKY